MKFYRIDAEHVPQSQLENLCDELESAGHEVMAAGMDPVFDHNIVIAIFAASKLKNEARDIVWKYNNGAWCAQKEISEDEADALC